MNNKEIQKQKNNQFNGNRYSKQNNYNNCKVVNAYNFVSLGDPKNIKRGKVTTGEFSGKLICTLKNLTPIFTSGDSKIRSSKGKNGKSINHNCEYFLCDNNNYIIAGSSLKGAIRNVIEVVTTSCIKNVVEKGVPLEFSPCSKEDELCFACRLFGSTGDTKNTSSTTALRGRVYFSDATIDKKKADIVANLVTIKSLYTPSPKCKKLYYLKNNIRGRKFYWHHANKIGKDLTTYENTIEDKKFTSSNSSIQFLKPLNTFNFEVHFDKLTEEELGVLIYSLQLEDGLAHKFGKAKSFGLGSCQIKIEKLYLETKDKYKSFTKCYENTPVDKFLNSCIEKYITDDRKEIKELKAILNTKNSIDFSKKFFPIIGDKFNSLPQILDY